MKKIIKVVARITGQTIIGILIILIVGFIFLYNFTGYICGNDIVSVSKSSDQKKTAIVFRRNCGATTDFSTQVSVRNNETILNSETGNVLIIDDNNDRDMSGFYLNGSPVVEASWIGPNELLLKFSSEARVFKQKTSWYGVKIDYETN